MIDTYHGIAGTYGIAGTSGTSGTAGTSSIWYPCEFK